MLAHGGVGGAIVELALVLVLVGLGAAVWWNGRRAKRDEHPPDATDPG